jgi:hypothetical protein
MKKLILTLFLILLPSTSHADIARYTGNDILAACESAYNNQFCIGYVQGIADAMGSGATVMGLKACYKTGLNTRQFIDASVKYIESDIPNRQTNGAYLVAKAISQTFPCP